MKYWVNGICLVPHQVSQTVEAKDEKEAEVIAKSNWKEHITHDGDERAAFKFEILNCEEEK